MGHTISGLHIDRPSQSYVGLFGAIGEGGVVNRVCVTQASIAGDNSVGAIAGAIRDNGKIFQSCSTGRLTAKNYGGGLVGRHQGSVVRCYSTGRVEADTTQAD